MDDFFPILVPSNVFIRIQNSYEHSVNMDINLKILLDNIIFKI